MALARENADPSHKDRWICMYPAYINSKKTAVEGRRITKEKGVDNPTVTEIRDVCQAIGLTAVVENKMYTRELNRDPVFRGRVRVQLKKEDGSPVLDQYPTRKALMIHLGELIPKLKSRTQKQGGSDTSGGGSQDKGKKNKRNRKR
ncbi:signal recognition particle 19 kDa protein-like [Amphiura filiformis]|uniref:signal recognition particle 19 kDa protein-like n=1 Tax=Amphiura filiformis TaxID=82378 RepID=UPI003B224747